VNIQCYDEPDKQAVEGILADHALGFPTYTARSKRQVRQILTNARTFLTQLDIKTALATSELVANHIVRFSNKNGTPTDSLLVGFAHGTSIAAIRKFQYLEGVKVSWRLYEKRPRLNQTQTCFRYNHVTHNCQNAKHCKRCGRQHPTEAACPEEQPFCVQCKTTGHLWTILALQDKNVFNESAVMPQPSHLPQPLF